MGSAAIINNDMDTRPELTPWLASVFVAPAYTPVFIVSVCTNAQESLSGV